MWAGAVLRAMWAGEPLRLNHRGWRRLRCSFPGAPTQLQDRRGAPCVGRKKQHASLPM
eukprot:CAMPEP_0181185820 /NCGR_PEP_ID=MMETSP1096-20121128/9711_1 /TAXON_ID=156174 ORGANISM="Chrysochromulina ericina, Strain CCMP281" /NCGR_SAMPLE_ID=MMETSP1096 /ASSEMBLY_ACC=CAM_ASM_000453 /LENGTH=57 /DNA_ID=CAMNT_0023274689 /DNA_START=748 /DNA_END=921 /DNA_ORIENTATION=+